MEANRDILAHARPLPDEVSGESHHTPDVLLKDGCSEAKVLDMSLRVAWVWIRTPAAAGTRAATAIAMAIGLPGRHKIEGAAVSAASVQILCGRRKDRVPLNGGVLVHLGDLFRRWAEPSRASFRQSRFAWLGTLHTLHPLAPGDSRQGASGLSQAPSHTWRSPQ
jgi:hypothetical protein